MAKVQLVYVLVFGIVKAKQYLPSLKTLQSDPDGHKKLMQLIKDQPHLVQNYNNSYNCIDGEGLKIEDIKILHYSDMGTQFSHKYSLPRLEKNNQKHWFDGKIMPHPRQDLVELFDQYYQEALDNGYKPEDYLVKAYGSFQKATQINYQGNKVTRPVKGTTWLTASIKAIKSKFSKKPNFTLDD